MVRFGFNWFLLSLSAGGLDANNDPIAQVATWIPFVCDAQSASGRFIVGNNGDQINISYAVFVAPGQNVSFVKGGTVRDHLGTERIILETEYNYLTV
jgi:hypothetical protein